MFSGKISRREMLEILVSGSAGIVFTGLGFFKIGNNSSALAQSSSTIDPKCSKVGYGNAKVTVIGDGSTYCAISDDGFIIYRGTDPTDVIHQGLNKGLTVGRKYKETVRFKGNFLNLRTILIPSFVTLDLSEASLKQANAIQNHLLTNKDKATSGNTSIDILQGIIDGNKAGNRAEVVEPGFTGDNIMNTIHLEKVSDCNINGITLINGYYHGVRIRDSTNISISNCTFKSVSLESISISGQGRPVGTCKQIRIFGNTVINSGNSAISTLKASDVLISGNICDTILRDATGITINGLNNQVVNNIIKNSYLDLISIAQINLPDYDASGSIVSGNICQKARLKHGITSIGYACKNLIITGNHVADTVEGISVSASNQNILISDNNIHSCRNSGIRVSGVKGHDIKYIRISNNMCYNNGAARDVNPLNKAGIRLSADEVGLLHDCVIENNSCFDDRQAKRTQDYGIRLVKTKDCIVRFNYMRNNLIAGISEVDNVAIVSHENVGQI